MRPNGLYKPWNIVHRLFQSIFLRRPEGRLWDLRAIRPIETSIMRLRPSRFFRFPGSKKLVRMAFRHLETSFRRLYQNHYLRRLEGRSWVLRAIHQLKTSLPRLLPNRFFQFREFRKCVLIVLRQHETSFHIHNLSDIIQVDFKVFILQKMCSYGLSKHWNVTSSTSITSFFKTSRRLILSSKEHSPT
jgi:hypothetical protein